MLTSESADPFQAVEKKKKKPVVRLAALYSCLLTPLQGF